MARLNLDGGRGKARLVREAKRATLKHEEPRSPELK
jgi:hypothetical protein